MALLIIVLASASARAGGGTQGGRDEGDHDAAFKYNLRTGKYDFNFRKDRL
ncbi:MAG TPA: hypothetical protein VFY12_11235 [Arenimonas sp.]|nr:hypothetical protein [Arenimonas sp.]